MNTTNARMAGILMPVASLPSADGVGSLGREAYRFVKLLEEMGIRIWQILPLNPLGYGNSPYQPFSSYAGDELYIDLDSLVKDGYLEPGREPYQSDGRSDRIDYVGARKYKEKYLRKAYETFRKTSRDNEEYQSFVKMEWVYPYAVFIALKKQNDLRCWNEWPKEQQDWILDRAYDISHLEDEIGYQLFTQFLFYSQWMKLKAYANEKQIQIMGDVPFYVGMDSLDVWSSREDFLLDEQWRPSFVAGVPPDYFSATGQRWGNPVYNWGNLERKGFTFWVNRLEYSSKLYDIVRIDHFRAFDTYWKIPSSCDTAVEGEWLEAPGYAFFNTLFRQLPDIRIVAEDLGDLRPEVLTLRDHFNLMGMNVAVFSLPYSDSVEEHQLIYTGTHDNQTVKDWYHVMDRKTKKKVRDKLAKFGHPRECINHLMLRYVYGSAASMAIVPLADILGLDHQARLNTPGTVGSPNWEWRLEDWRSLHRKKVFVRAVVLESGRALVK